VEFGPFSAEFGVVDVVSVAAIWHLCPLEKAAPEGAIVEKWSYAALKRRSSTSLRAWGMNPAIKNATRRGRVCFSTIISLYHTAMGDWDIFA
jgi:hypothetical protein